MGVEPDQSQPSAGPVYSGQHTEGRIAVAGEEQWQLVGMPARDSAGNLSLQLEGCVHLTPPLRLRLDLLLLHGTPATPKSLGGAGGRQSRRPCTHPLALPAGIEWHLEQQHRRTSGFHTESLPTCAIRGLLPHPIVKPMPALLVSRSAMVSAVANVTPMTARIEVGGWEHSCCGPEIRRGESVRWDCIRAEDSRLVETHHDLEGLSIEKVDGIVEDILVRHPNGEATQIVRIPSGRALRGMDSDDDGLLMSRDGGTPFGAPSEDFLVTLRVSP